MHSGCIIGFRGEVLRFVQSRPLPSCAVVVPLVFHDLDLISSADAPLSGASLALMAEFERAAEELSSEKFPAKLGKVDVSAEKDLGKEFKSQKYPVLNLFTEGNRKNPINCKGVNAAPSIITWLKRRIGSSAIFLVNTTHTETFIGSEDVVIIGFFKDLRGNDTNTFYEVAKDIPHLPFGVTNNTESFIKYGVTKDTVTLFKKSEDKQVNYESAERNRLDKDNLTKFIRVNELSLVTEYNRLVSSGPFSYDHFHFCAIFLCSTLQLLFILVDANESKNGRMMEMFRIRDVDIPALRAISMSDGTRYRMQADEVTTENVVTFCREYLDGKAKPQQYSEELPPDWNKQPVKVLVGTNFDDVVFNITKNVFVMFYAPWSQRCKEINPIWDQVGEKYQESENIEIAKIDITANDVDSVLIEGYPSFKYFPAGSDGKVCYFQDSTVIPLYIFEVMPAPFCS
uniref:protein disulfide-isomerase n=1 Tax=Callorhinchus milii TaxID=7868 RepID=A0A4W3IT15_CALMI